MDDNWQFKIGKPTDSQGKFDKAGFGPAMFTGKPVNLPHDWAVELPFANNSLRNMGYKAIGVDFRDNSIGWYAREFTVPEKAEGRRFWLEFDGVFRACQVWVNGMYYGRHESGYQAIWSDTPMIKILPDWSLPDKVGTEVTLFVYSNAEEVELTVNNQVAGRGKPFAGRAQFKVRYQPGVVVARGYRDGKVVAETRSETAGAAAMMHVEPDRTDLAADGQDVAVVNVRILDDKGRFVPAADNLVEFSLTGPGQIIGVGNGDPLSHDSEKEPRRKAFNGLCQVLVQTTRTAGQIELTATSANLKPMSVKLQAQPCTPPPSVP